MTRVFLPAFCPLATLPPTFRPLATISFRPLATIFFMSRSRTSNQNKQQECNLCHKLIDNRAFKRHQTSCQRNFDDENSAKAFRAMHTHVETSSEIKTALGSVMYNHSLQCLALSNDFIHNHDTLFEPGPEQSAMFEINTFESSSEPYDQGIVSCFVFIELVINYTYYRVRT